jgi:outer membrane phospholipase A
MRVLVLLVNVLLAAPALGANLDIVVAVPDEPLRAGEQMVFSIYLHNAGDEAVQVDLPSRITCRLSSSGQTLEVPANSLEPKPESPVTIAGKSFFKARYMLTLPSSLEGPTRVEVEDFDGSSVLVSVLARQAPPLEPKEKDDETEIPSFDAVDALYQPYLVNISAYQPMYFLVGTDPKKSKFQFSFKYRFFNPEGWLGRKAPWVTGFHFAYTQTSFWDLESASRPFEDTSYKPELFFLTGNLGKRLQWVRGIFLQAGFQHESNGRGGDASRSADYIYAKPIFIFYDEDSQLGMMVAPKVWIYGGNESENNSDLEQYRGYFDLEWKFGKADSFVVGTHFGWAEQGGSVQANLTYPLSRFLLRSLDLYFHFQYVNALAESLINYRERTEAFRLGFSIVR